MGRSLAKRPHSSNAALALFAPKSLGRVVSVWSQKSVHSKPLAATRRQDRLGRPTAATEKASQSWGSHKWVALLRKPPTGLSPSVLRLSDRITRQRVGSTQQLVLGGTRSSKALRRPDQPGAGSVRRSIRDSGCIACQTVR